MRSFDIKALTEGGLLTALTVIFGLMSVYLPVIGMVAVFIWPLPIVVLVVRHGVKTGVLSTLSAGIILAVLIEPMVSLRMILGFALPSLVLGYGFKNNWSAGKNLLLSLGVSIVSMLMALLLLFTVTGINPLSMQVDSLKEAFDYSIDFYANMGLNEAELQEQRDVLEYSFKLVSMMMPLVVLTSSLLVTWLNFVIGGAILRRLGHNVPTLPVFNQWRLPRIIAYAMGFALVGLYWGTTHDMELVFQAAINLYFLASMAGFIQGASLLCSITDHFKLPRIFFWLIVIFLFFSGITAQILSFIGIADIIFDYRRRMTANRY